MNTSGTAPSPGQFLSYDGASLAWRDPSTVAESLLSLNGTTAYYNGGSVGLGTDRPDPGVRLQVEGAVRVAPGGKGGLIQFGTPNSETGMTISGTGRADL